MLVYDFREESKQKERQLAFALHAFSTPLECLRTKKTCATLRLTPEKKIEKKNRALDNSHMIRVSYTFPGFSPFSLLLANQEQTVEKHVALLLRA